MLTYPAYPLVCFSLCSCLKRRVTNKKLVTEHTQTPQINLWSRAKETRGRLNERGKSSSHCLTYLLVMLLVFNHFWW